MPSSADSRAATRPCGRPSTREGHDGQGIDAQIWPENAYPRDAGESMSQEVADMTVMGDDRRPANLSEGIDCRVQCHSTDNVRGASFFSVGRVVPDDVVEFDEVDRSAACKKGVTFRESGAGSNEYARPKGRIHLVTAPNDKVGIFRERTMRCELGAINSHRDLASVRGLDDLFDRWHPSGDIRSTGDCEQPGLRSPVQFSHDIGCRECSVRTALDESAGGYARPRQKVGVVFDNGGDHDVVETAGAGGRRGG